MVPVLQTFLRYLHISCLSFAVNLGLTIVLHEVLRVPEEAAVACALVVVFLMNFVAMRSYIYRASRGALWRQFLAYSGSALLFRLVEYGAFLAGHTWLRWDYRLVVFLVTLVAAVVKFLYYRVLFERRSQHSQAFPATLPTAPQIGAVPPSLHE